MHFLRTDCHCHTCWTQLHAMQLGRLAAEGINTISTHACSYNCWYLYYYTQVGACGLEAAAKVKQNCMDPLTALDKAIIAASCNWTKIYGHFPISLVLTNTVFACSICCVEISGMKVAFTPAVSTAARRPARRVTTPCCAASWANSWTVCWCSVFCNWFSSS